MSAPNGLAMLPPKVFRIVIDMLDMNNICQQSGRGEEFRLAENRKLRIRTLKDLSMVSESIRKLAQPLLFHNAALGLYPRAIQSRAEFLLRLIEARPDSTSWLKRLLVQLETHALDDATLLAVSTLLSRLDGLRFLYLSALHPMVVNASPQLFVSITDLQIAGVQDPEDLDGLIVVLSRCPNLTSLTCGFPVEAPHFEIPSTTIPHLSQLKAPMMLARLLVPGRPVEILQVDRSLGPGNPSMCRREDLVLLAGSSKPIRHLVLPSIQWSEDFFEHIVGFFPFLERLSFHVAWSQKDWLPTHLVSIASFLSCLEKVKITALPPLGPPSEEELDAQLELLQEARRVQPRLKEVSFLEDVRWVADSTGFWTAVFQTGSKGRIVYLTPSPEMKPRPRASSHSPADINPEDRLSNLPTEILLHILSFLKQIAAADISRPYSPSGNLKALCLASRTLSSLAQPVLFRRVQLNGGPRIARFLARKLERMFDSKEGSANWVLQLNMSWEPMTRPGMQGAPEEPEVKEQLEQLAGNLLARMRNLRILHIGQIGIPHHIYARMYHLPLLTKVVIRGTTVIDAPDVTSVAPDTLTLAYLTISCRHSTTVADFERVDPSIAKLARSPHLKMLRIWSLLPETLNNILGSNSSGSSLSELEELEIINSRSSFGRLLSISSRCAALWKLSLGPATRRKPPASLPSTIAPEVWPLLRELSGWLEAGQLIVPGRPIEKIKIRGTSRFGDAWDRTALIPLGQGAAVVKELHLEDLAWHDECVEHIAATFPDLEVLDVYCDGPDSDWLLNNLLRVVKLFHRLRSVTISVGTRQRSFQRTRTGPRALEESQVLPLLREARLIRPSLVTVFFGHLVGWSVSDGEDWTSINSWLIGADFD